MILTNISELRKNLKTFIGLVNKNDEPVLIKGVGEEAVLISLKTYNKVQKKISTKIKKEKRTLGLLKLETKLPNPNEFNASIEELNDYQ